MHDCLNIYAADDDGVFNMKHSNRFFPPFNSKFPGHQQPSKWNAYQGHKIY